MKKIYINSEDMTDKIEVGKVITVEHRNGKAVKIEENSYIYDEAELARMRREAGR